MTDFSWLAQEAKSLHTLFENIFYGIVTVLILIGVAIEFFKIPLGGTPSVQILIGRAVIATVMLITFPEVTNTLADLTDNLGQEIGDLSNITKVTERLSEKLEQETFSIQVKRLVIGAVAFLSHLILYISLFILDALYFFTWSVLYIIAPLCFALFALPQTAGLAKNLYKSLFIVSSWKISWHILSALLWSAALIEFEKTGSDIGFFTLISFNLLLALSMFFFPIVVTSFINTGLHSFSGRMAGFAASAALLATSRAGALALNRGKDAAINGYQGSKLKLLRHRDRIQRANNPYHTSSDDRAPKYENDLKKHEPNRNRRS